MIKRFLVFVALLSPILASAQKVQENAPQPSTIFTYVERPPQAMIDINTYMQSNLRYPEKAIESGIHGRVLVRFVVEMDGSVSNVEIRNSVSPALDSEAIRVVTAMPKWNPGMQNGKPVRVYFNLPINFALTDKK